MGLIGDDYCTNPVDFTIKDSECNPLTFPYIQFTGNQTLYSVLNISPSSSLSTPVFFNNQVTITLKDGTDYNITYQRAGCNDVLSYSFSTKGFYFKLESQPLCLKSQVKLNVFNPVGQVAIDGLVSDSNSAIVGVGQHNIVDMGNNCNKQLYVWSASPTIFPVYTLSHSTCGFNNGTISLTTPGQYSNITLAFQDPSGDMVPVQSNSVGSYANLAPGVYALYTESQTCGYEVTQIPIIDLFASTHIEYSGIQNMEVNSTIKFVIQDPKINQTKNPIFTWRNQPVSNYNSFQGMFQTGFNDYTFSYDNGQCSKNLNFGQFYSRADVSYTVVPPSSGSCKDNSTFVLKTSMDLFPENQNYQIINNTISAPYYSLVNLISRTSGNTFMLENPFVPFPTYVIKGSPSASRSCWDTFSVTITNLEYYESVYMIGRTRSGDVRTEITGDTFYNLPMTYNILFFKAKTCAEYQGIGLPSYQGYNQSDLDNTKIEYEIIQYPTCENDKATVNYTLTSPTGLKFGPFSFTTNNRYSYTYSFNNWCFYPFEYALPQKISKPTATYDVSITSEPTCQMANGLFSVTNGNSMYEIDSLYVNGVLSEPDLNGNYSAPSGNDINIKITWKNTNTQLLCYSNLNKTFTPISTVDSVEYIVTNVSDCNQLNGKIQIVDYQKYSSVKMNGGDPDSNGIFDQLSSGDYTLEILIDGCYFTQVVSVPTSTDSSIFIFQDDIRQTTCQYDGKIALDIYQYGTKLENISISTETRHITSNVIDNLSPGNVSIVVTTGSCRWNRSFTLTQSDPLISLQYIFNTTMYGQPSVGKLITKNRNVQFTSVDSLSNAFIYTNQSEYYVKVSSQSASNMKLSVSWNSYCQASYTFLMPTPNYSTKMLYELTKPQSCNVLGWTLRILNFDDYAPGGLLFKNYGAYKQPDSNGYFYNVGPTSGLEFTYVKKNNLAVGTYNINFELTYGYTNANLSVNIYNKVCGQYGGLNINDFDLTNYYYVLSYNLLNSDTRDYGIIEQTTTNKFKPGYYTLQRVSRNATLCRTAVNVNILEDSQPIVNSVAVTNAVNGNGTIKVHLNLIPTNALYQLDNQTAQSSNTFTNINPGLYTITITIKDSACPKVLTTTCNVTGTPSQSSSSDDINHSPNQYQSINLLLFFFSIITILI